MDKISTFTPVVGIEIHVELATKSKMFCGCKNDPFFAPEPNIYTCPVCLGMPGALPVANKKAIEWTIKIGLALGCKINLFSKFDRKHYFYPDLPKGYQISQYDQPLCYEGSVDTEFGPVRITRVHLEEDTGKLLHQNNESLIDFNRSGVPLVEIVSEPDIHSPEAAKAYTKKIAEIIKALEVSSADMEKGSMRLEANISVTFDKSLPPYKVEVKNLNSFRYIERAIAFETVRQSEIRRKGELPRQETRGWNESKGETFAQRSKESAEDYRYFPDPDLPPLHFTKEFVEGIMSALPRLPQETVAHLQELGLKESDAKIIAKNPKLVAVMEELGGSAARVANLVVNGKITGDTKEILLEQMAALESTVQMDDSKLSQVIATVLSENPKAVSDYKAGKQQVLGFIIGMVFKKAGRVDRERVQESIQKELHGQ
ncbi:MAG TPA: Asp-tRNA(Asn)/Glu-tRNA(Gln) amidotransferase subunit GatB [Patescibacteria group bacterium]|nr:Asp-tRNA(Asn)/Glu-tRNA(Gln) amidotransferase subunit GatB [Patescibacteria group bacterium]